MRKTIKILGLMSGTSADGLSIALCSVRPVDGAFKTLAGKTYAYTPGLRERILSAKSMRAPELSGLNFELGRLWAAMVRRFCLEHKVPYKNLAVIGSHGQTVYHLPGLKGGTLQIGEPAFIAEETGRPVVSDFRPADMAAGGEGAPLIPFMDEYLFGGGRRRPFGPYINPKERGKPVALQNIGGVGNIAFVGKGLKTSGFDTGPGNSLMDTAAALATRGKIAYDKAGRLAAAGRADRVKVERLLKLPFFALRPPKSLDRDAFSAAFLNKHFGLINPENIKSILATLNLFTAAAIALAFKKYAPEGTKEVIVSGGGALNPVLMRNISGELPGVKVESIVAYGIHPLAKEPACFALLAWLALNGRVNHCPSATGASGPRVLGKLISGS
jgi:anhydro-N-acetylmuramic acid kinase